MKLASSEKVDAGNGPGSHVFKYAQECLLSIVCNKQSLATSSRCGNLQNFVGQVVHIDVLPASTYTQDMYE